jgi:hypothetical protein
MSEEEIRLRCLELAIQLAHGSSEETVNIARIMSEFIFQHKDKKIISDYRKMMLEIEPFIKKSETIISISDGEWVDTNDLLHNEIQNSQENNFDILSAQ